MRACHTSPAVPALRVRLRPVTEADATFLAPWLPEAIAAIDGRGTPVERGLALPEVLQRWERGFPGGRTLVADTSDGATVGLLRLRARPGGPLVIEALTVRADARNLGYGQEIVIAAEALAGRSNEIAAAGVPRRNGLAIYFWLRAGYRPQFTQAATARGLDPARLWMTRALTDAPYRGPP